MIFDGKAFARKIEEQVKNKVTNLVKKPRIVSILVGDDPASALYTKLKKAAAERVGINFEIFKIDSEKWQVESLSSVIKKIGEREDVTGVMVQLPLPDVLRGETSRILAAIPLTKDVDGLRWEESGVVPATVSAVLSIVDAIAEGKTKFVVLGARGAVGRPLVHYLKKRGVEVTEVEWDTPLPSGSLPVGQVVISCVGQAGLVSGDMVQQGTIVIDVGAPKGDMTAEVYQKASISVEVPGGVGPVTIACLLQNVLEIREHVRRL